MKVSFVLLAHEPPNLLYHLIKPILASGSDIYVHYDANSPFDLSSASKDWELDQLPGTLYFAQRLKIVWGEWSIVQATLNCLYLAKQQGYRSEYLMLISGSCMPTKPLDNLCEYLSEAGKDHIELVNAETNRWVKGGIQQERWEYHHFFNGRHQQFLFRASNKLQKILRIKRFLPLCHTAHIGSQWWCLRVRTVDAILDMVSENEDLLRFYRHTWIPDELFFQTLVANLVPHNEIRMAPLTQYQFNSWGVPRTYYADALPELVSMEGFFARKISPRAVELKESLAQIGAMSKDQFRNYINTHSEDFKNRFETSLELSIQVQRNDWRSLAAAQIWPHDFCKAIPIPLVVICSLDSAAKKETLESLSSLDSIALHGDLLGEHEIEFGDNQTNIFGYNRADSAVARHRWHFFLGDLVAYHTNANCLVFTMGEEATEYLDALRWNHGLTVIKLKGKSPLDEKNLDMHQLFQANQLQRKEYWFNRDLQTLMEDRHCSYYVVDSNNHAQISQIVRALS